MMVQIQLIAGLLLIAFIHTELMAQTAPSTQVSPEVEQARVLLAAGKAPAARKALLELAEQGDLHAQDALAAMWLRGIGGAKDRSVAMRWYCQLAHQPSGGRIVMRAVWFLAEYFRTGGGLPGQRYNDGELSAENPLKAYFWFQVMAQQEKLYSQVDEESQRLGLVGVSSMQRQLFAGEQQQISRFVQRWKPDVAMLAGETCLQLPQP